jgi:methylated-DNA-[protein]-cysteine S-methyltransferase
METLTIDTPIGPLHLAAQDGHIVCLGFGPGPEHGPEHTLEHTLLRRAAAQVAAYFTGAREPFDLPLAPAETIFQAKVRAAMLAIPFGETRSYGEVATAVGGVPRAVGQACGANPIPIIVPCHRVLAAGGGIGGFSGGDGPPTKRKLLAHEAGPVFG